MVVFWWLWGISTWIFGMVFLQVPCLLVWTGWCTVDGTSCCRYNMRYSWDSWALIFPVTNLKTGGGKVFFWQVLFERITLRFDKPLKIPVCSQRLVIWFAMYLLKMADVFFLNLRWQPLGRNRKVSPERTRVLFLIWRWVTVGAGYHPPNMWVLGRWQIITFPNRSVLVFVSRS